MTDQSERIPASDDYLRALGRATYNFAYLEWAVVWLMETMQPSFLQQVAKMTAGQIADHFCDAVEKLDNTVSDKEQLREISGKFKSLVSERNSLMHGNPYTAVGGEQRLLYIGRHGRRDWTLASMRDFSSRTATASIEANGVLHSGRLQQYQSSRKSGIS